MTNFTVESKSQLAKLMATENLTIQHSKIQTAKFDPKNRVLYLPIWQNMTGALYDLLTGHEVGHALYTPAEGWHDAVVDKTKSKNFKSFLNVVEDARIEKKVQRKYPGLKASFIKAYTDLMGRDFFGIRGRDINDMAFINRLNIYTKSQYSMKVFFTGEEQKMVDKVKAAETWADVVKVANEIYAYSKDEQADMPDLDDFDFNNQAEFDDEFGEDSDSANEGNADEAGTGDDEGKGSGDESEQESEAEKEKTKEFQLNNDKESNVAMEDQFEPRCETDEAFRKNEAMLLDEKSKDYVYVTFPKAHLDKIVTPYKKVHSLMEESWKQQLDGGLFAEGDVQQLVRDFKNKNEKYISLLAKEFEMKKAAKSFAKAKISDTGDIDINKIATYSFDDNIFRKVMMVPKGKSHGLILLLDYSGSMSQNMGGSIEQILVLAMFCRKVNIPFHVYSFSDSWSNWKRDHGIDTNSEAEMNTMFTNNPGEVRMKSVLLREYLNSKMGNAEFSRCLKNMLMLKASYDDRNTRYGPVRFFRPESENLSNTPLSQAICAMKDVMLNFRKVNNLDLSSLVIVHDGEADQISTYYPTNPDESNTIYRDKMFESYSTNIIFTDPKLKFEYRVDPEADINRDYVMKATLEWFRKATNSKVFGFFITPNSSRNLQGAIINKYYDESGKQIHRERFHWEKAKELSKELKTNKALVSHNPGFNKFFFILGGKDLNTEIDEIEIEGKVTTNKLKNAFMKFNKKRQVNRIVVSKFIEGIAA
jgi:hypothetical protein